MPLQPFSIQYNLQNCLFDTLAVMSSDRSGQDGVSHICHLILCPIPQLVNAESINHILTPETDTSVVVIVVVYSGKDSKYKDSISQWIS